MHIADQESGNLGANAIVGGSTGIAAGAALSAKKRGTDQVAVCFFGEGALNQGLLYEAMNMAALWRLPVIYVCENNVYNEYTHYSETTAGDLLARATALGVPAEDVDGQDVRAVYAAAASCSVTRTATSATTSETSTERTGRVRRRMPGRRTAIRSRGWAAG
jgi:pyruvate dehydrogenase E1 component alpha subunit